MATIFGTTGNDTGIRSLFGTNAADFILGNGGNDMIFGAGGNDTIHVNGGNSTVDAGTGNDTVVGFGIRTGTFDGGLGIDTFIALNPIGNGIYRLDGSPSGIGSGPGFTLKNFENITTGDRDDTIFGSDHANVIRAGGGSDSVYAGRGHDTVYGGAGDDFLYGASGEDLFDGGTGNDYINGGTEYDTATYAGRAERIYVKSNGEVEVGLNEVDRLVSVEKVIGGDAGDQFSAGVATDFDGGKGRDTYYANDKASVFNGGEDIDYVVYTASTSGVGVDLQQGSGWMGFATGDRLISVEDIAGSWHSDILRGSTADNFIAGLDGDDLILGRDGNDTLFGGGGSDTLTGGAGRDVFMFSTSDGYGQDRITDFQRGIDEIVIQGDANVHVAGTQTFTRLTRYEDPVHADGFTAGTVNIRHSGGHTYVDFNSYDNPVDGMDQPEISIRIDGIHDLRLSDFDF